MTTRQAEALLPMRATAPPAAPEAEKVTLPLACCSLARGAKRTGTRSATGAPPVLPAKPSRKAGSGPPGTEKAASLAGSNPMLLIKQ